MSRGEDTFNIFLAVKTITPVAGYLVSQPVTWLSIVYSLFLIIAATALCQNLKGQVKFFADMLRVTVRITEKVEAILLSYREKNNSEIIPIEILATYNLRKQFPGNIHVRRRELVFSIFQYILYILIVISVFQCLTVLSIRIWNLPISIFRLLIHII